MEDKAREENADMMKKIVKVLFDNRMNFQHCLIEGHEVEELGYINEEGGKKLEKDERMMIFYCKNCGKIV